MCCGCVRVAQLQATRWSAREVVCHCNGCACVNEHVRRTCKVCRDSSWHMMRSATAGVHVHATRRRCRSRGRSIVVHACATRQHHHPIHVHCMQAASRPPGAARQACALLLLRAAPCRGWPPAAAPVMPERAPAGFNPAPPLARCNAAVPAPGSALLRPAAAAHLEQVPSEVCLRQRQRAATGANLDGLCARRDRAHHHRLAGWPRGGRQPAIIQPGAAP